MKTMTCKQLGGCYEDMV